MIRETENDELTGVMEELIETYSDDIGDVAVNLCASLVREHPLSFTPLSFASPFMYSVLDKNGYRST